MKGFIIFDKIRRYIRVNKPTNVKDNEINMYCNNYTWLNSLIDIIFSILHSKRENISSNKIDILKVDLNLVHIK